MCWGLGQDSPYHKVLCVDLVKFTKELSISFGTGAVAPRDPTQVAEQFFETLAIAEAVYLSLQTTNLKRKRGVVEACTPGSSDFVGPNS